jgi:hypothetical protein
MATVVPTREEAINRYRTWLQDKLRARDPKVCATLDYIEIKARQGDVSLICWCAPKACHGDVIKEIIDRRINQMTDYDTCMICHEEFHVAKPHHCKEPTTRAVNVSDLQRGDVIIGGTHVKTERYTVSSISDHKPKDPRFGDYKAIWVVQESTGETKRMIYPHDYKCQVKVNK